MTSFDLSETIIAELVAALEDRLPSEVEAVNTAYPDEFQIPMPAIFDYVPSVSEVGDQVYVGIQEGQVELRDDVGWSATGEFPFGLVCVVQNADQRAMVKQIRRLVRAVANAALRDRDLGGTTSWGVRPLGMQPGPARRHPESPDTWASFSIVGIVVNAEQDQA